MSKFNFQLSHVFTGPAMKDQLIQSIHTRNNDSYFFLSFDESTTYRKTFRMNTASFI